MPIVEFKERYPDYKLGFLEQNMPTETEKLVGLRMHLLFSSVDDKEYQCFSIPEMYYNELSKMLNAVTSPNQYVVMSVNDADFYLQKKKDSILGICKQTKERVAISTPITLVLTREDEKEEEWENIMDGLGGDWEG